ncbi:MAG: fibronectin type III domain-containing protein [Candidatus Sungbacteria bacterium]|uniref:Fibronectin type III domain-containing protein n=1 Tax=Candidatus Sungiibacteriota bacterium TaxID=2750080 RepID=A0A9D6LQC2_9BACT|nr:fibronectin type III domain-containing protein [Candidatus Sungbacteria bacterium]
MNKRFLRSLFSASLIIAINVLNAGPALALGELPTDTTPPVISGAATTTILPTGATLVWTTNELAVSTFEYGTTQSYGSSSALSASAAIGGATTLAGLAPSTTYYYCIHATDTSNNSSQSCGSFTTAVASDVTAPIVSLLFAVATTTSATITWTTSENADGEVQYGTTGSYGSTSNLNATLALSHSVELSNLSTDTTYHYRVLSRDAAGNLTTGSDATFSTSALPSAGGSVTVTDTIPPVVTDVSSLSLEPHDATIAWTTDELAISTLEYGTTTSYGSSATLSGTALLIHAAELLGLQANTTYYYCIHATDLAGNVASSCGHSFTSAAQETMLDTNPPTVSLITVRPITTSSATINWTTDEIAGGYVEYGTTIGYGSETTFDTNLALTHEATLSGLSPGTEYHYRVHSHDEAGNNITTPDETFTTASLPPIPIVETPTDTTPPLISEVAVSSISSALATISWTTNELAISTLQYGTTPSYGSSAELSASGLLVHDATLVGLSPLTTYYYCIHATDLAGNTANSCGHSLSTAAPPVIADTTAPAASLVIVSSITADSALIHWTSTEQADSQIEYGTTTNYGSETPVEAETASSGSASLANLSPATTYHFRIRSYDSSGNVGLSGDYTFTTAAASGASGVSANAPPIISEIGADTIGETSATVNWTTDVPSDSLVEYGNTENLGSTAGSATLSTSHSIALADLLSDTNYQFRVVSKPAGGAAFQATSPLHDFNTLAVPIIVDPPANITSLSESTNGTGASVSFTTDELTTGQVEYGLDTSYGLNAAWAEAQEAGTLSLTNLEPGATYHYRLKAVDAGGNITYSEDHAFTTPGAPSGGQTGESFTAPPESSSNGLPAQAGGGAGGTAGGGGGGGGGGGSSAASVPVPNLVTAEGVDSEIVFSWNNPETAGFANTLIVRKAGSYPASPQDGEAIYEGPRETFTDTNLVNGTTYYYSLYSYNTANQHSYPIHVSNAPKGGVTEVKIERNAVLENVLPMEHFTDEYRERASKQTHNRLLRSAHPSST